MAAPTVYENVGNDAAVQGQLFAGKKFFLIQRLPLRSTFIERIRNNGGEIVTLEKKADYLIADHHARESPPGSISYRFIDASIKNGELADPENHRAGPPVGTPRPAGSSSLPTKGGRAAYTTEEDRILYKWVRDYEARGGAASGNEIYKQLGEKYPRHTWQSWRDRYLKQLRHRPPSAFSIPDNAPPSPPSDAPVELVPKAQQRKKAPPKETAPVTVPSTAEPSRTLRGEKEYTVDDFDKVFSKEDWEELYAFVDEIQSRTGEGYYQAWEAWADTKTQSAEQWRQYFEKVVLPQWKRDPVSKREEVRREVEKRYEERASQKASQASQEQAEADEVVVKQESKLEDQMVQRSPQVRLSSSTVVRQTPEYNAEAYDKTRKRIREGNYPGEEADEEHTKTPRPAKRAKSRSPSLIPQQSIEDVLPDSTSHLEPLELSSNASSPSESPLPLDDMAPLSPLPLPNDARLPSNTPTPRGKRHKPPASDTQAILSDSQPFTLEPLPRPPSFGTQAILSPTQPSQPFTLKALPRPPGLSQSLFSEDDLQEPPSEASTTRSLLEFRSSLRTQPDARTPSPPLAPLPLPTSAPAPASSPPRSTSPASSAADSNSASDTDPTDPNIDPDLPLTPRTLPPFFAAHEGTYGPKLISRALQRTNFRPQLALAVLRAWAEGEALPETRGVWTERDDEDVLGGDTAAMLRLEGKHSVDGWGGVVERMKILEKFGERRREKIGKGEGKEGGG